jgi:hypothetical protein
VVQQKDRRPAFNGDSRRINININIVYEEYVLCPPAYPRQQHLSRQLQLQLQWEELEIILGTMDRTITGELALEGLILPPRTGYSAVCGGL